MTSDTRPSTLALDVPTLARALRLLSHQRTFDYQYVFMIDGLPEFAREIAAEYSRLLEERVAPESES